MSRIENQANYYKNYHLQKRDTIAVIHLEDEEDKEFWDFQLQRVLPGHYHFVPRSKSEKGKDSSGCEQCLLYRPYLNNDFFICIDSDLRLLCNEYGLIPENYIAQTYTYSWESHCCEANHLQSRFKENVPESDFNFEIFLNEFSKIVYMPLLYLVYYKSNALTHLWNVKLFNRCIPLPNKVDLNDNCQMYLNNISQQFKIAIDTLQKPIDFNIENLTPDNAYLHIQGHRLYDLISHIGKLLCAGKKLDFKSKILNAGHQTSGYIEIEQVQADLSTILIAPKLQNTTNP